MSVPPPGFSTQVFCGDDSHSHFPHTCLLTFWGSESFLTWAGPGPSRSQESSVQLFLRGHPFWQAPLVFSHTRDAEHWVLLASSFSIVHSSLRANQCRFLGACVLMLLGLPVAVFSYTLEPCCTPDLDWWVPGWHGWSLRSMAGARTLSLPQLQIVTFVTTSFCLGSFF